MAVAFTEIIANQDNVDRNAYTTASVTLTAGKLYLFGTATSNAAAGQPTVATTGGAITFTEAGTGATVNGVQRLDVWRCLPSSTVTDTIVITHTSDTGAEWALYEVTGMDTSGTNGSGAIRQTKVGSTGNATTITVTLDSAIVLGNGRFAWAMANVSGTMVVNTGSGTWASHTALSHATPTQCSRAASTAGPATTDTSFIASGLGTTRFGAMVVEVAAGSASDTQYAGMVPV